VASACARPHVTSGPPSAPQVVVPSSAAPAPVSAPTTIAETRLSRLAAVVAHVLAAPAFDRATTAFVARSLATGETLYQHNGGVWLVPASTMKVLTTVAAADRLGWGYRFETRLVAMGPVVNGTLRGDLLVVGTGDPTINPRHPERMTAFDEWARALAAKGIRHIAGHVVGDDTAFEEPGVGIGWAWDDLVLGYGAAYGALQFNDNEAEVTMGPGTTPGAPPVVYVSPSNHGLLLDVQAVTAAEGTPSSLVVARVPGTRFLDVTGRAPLGTAPVSDMVAVANPTLFFAAELRATLVRHGIVVDGTAVDLDEHDERPRAADGTTLLVDLSPPLSAIVQPMLQWSRNSYAETLVTALDAVPPASAGEGLAVLRNTLAALGVAPESYHVRDGSGLSRNDYVSANALVDTLTAAWTRPDLRGPLLAALPEAGRPGTFSRRLADTPAAGRVHAKTGSMSNVRSLAGYVTTAADEPVVFAFISNGFDVRGSEIDARVDELILALVTLAPAPE
jgi:serine-type D-Ala-D-Ala carboxypeptidase/endopeptidase (penicillin-binding protein 4)